MLRLKILLGLAVISSVAFAQNAPVQEPVLDVRSMDTSVDPCSDFFAYSCGGWLKKNPIPPDQTSWSVYSKLADENKTILRNILEKASAGSSDDAAGKKIGDYYTACMDEKAIEAAGVGPLKPDFERIERLRSTREIAPVAAALIDDNALFNFRSDQDFKNSSQVIAEADQGGLGLPDRDYYLKDDAKSEELRKVYLAHLQKIFELLGDSAPTAATERKR